MRKQFRALVTAGHTDMPIDKVRVISNIFKGKTGAAIAKHFADKGCDVILLTSNPELVANKGKGITVITYRTYDQLAAQMKMIITNWKKPDVIIHSAAVSDYKVSGVFVRGGSGLLTPIDSSGKISSKNPELFLRLVLTDKLVDLVRTKWRFEGLLVKFKLEVGISDAKLIAIAKKSQKVSGANIMVANCLEWAHQYAYILGPDGSPVRVSRRSLPSVLYRKIEPSQPIMRWRA